MVLIKAKSCLITLLIYQKLAEDHGRKPVVESVIWSYQYKSYEKYDMRQTWKSD